MELLAKLERMVLGWVKSLPHLPVSARKWLGDNIWWIIVIATVLSGIGVLGLMSGLFANLASLTGPVVTYYTSPAFVEWLVISTAISLAFAAVEFLLLAFSISALKAKQKKGWVLLFAAWLVAVIAMVVGAILTLNPFSFLSRIIFGAIWVGLAGYLLFEIHGQFAHVERSNGVKGKKKTA